MDGNVYKRDPTVLNTFCMSWNYIPVILRILSLLSKKKKCFAFSIPLIYFKLADEIACVYYGQCDAMNTYVKGKHHLIHLGCIQHCIQIWSHTSRSCFVSSSSWHVTPYEQGITLIFCPSCLYFLGAGDGNQGLMHAG